MENDIKIGGYLYCHTDLIMEDDLSVAATAGKKYLVVSITEYGLDILNNQHKRHGFSCDGYSFSYYKQWFNNLNNERKLKIKKLSTL
jgi:hypothetical protein